jgi:hypothetical protein
MMAVYVIERWCWPSRRWKMGLGFERDSEGRER